jgi:hypothetical protein
VSRVSTVKTRHVVAVAGCAAVLAACSGSSTPKADFAGTLCLGVRVWNDQSVDVVNGFSDHSVAAAAPADRRHLYQGAFDRLDGQIDGLQKRISSLPSTPDGAPAVRSALDELVVSMRTTVKDGRRAADALPDSAYTVASVTDGRLFTGLEKNQALVYQSLRDLSARYGTTLVPDGCGRRDALDISPSVTG